MIGIAEAAKNSANSELATLRDSHSMLEKVQTFDKQIARSRG